MPQNLLEGMSSRKRRPNWTDHESLLLTQLVQERKDIIRGKCSTGISVQDKRQAWEDIALAINSAFPEIQRTVSDCSKKWENLLAKSREEIRRLRRQEGEGLSLKQFSTVTQIVISVMNLSNTLQQDVEDSLLEPLEEQQDSCTTGDESVTHSSPLIKREFLRHPDPATSTPPAEQTIAAFTNAFKPLPLQFSTPRAAVFAVAEEHSGTHSTSPPSEQCTALQERMDLELSVLRRQEAVLKLQEEYYTLKIKLMKKQIEEPVEKH